MADTSIVIIDPESSHYTLRVALEQRYDVAASHARDTIAGLDLVRSAQPDFILLNPSSIGPEVTAFLMQLEQLRQNTPVIIAGNQDITSDMRSLYSYVVGYVPSTFNESDLMPFLQQRHPAQPVRSRKRALADRASLVQTNQMLERRVQEMMTLYQIGKAVASLTDLDAILARIAEAAVFLLRADESSIMLKDSETNELYLRAQKGLGEKQARGFNLKIEDTLIGSVVQTGRPVRLAKGTSDDTQLKVVTGYLVNALLYVPLALRGQIIGVLGVANETAHKAFDEHDQRLMEALADYATLAIEVARQHKMLQRWRQDSAVVYTITSSVDEIRARLATDDPDMLGALDRIEGAIQNLTNLAESETPIDV